MILTVIGNQKETLLTFNTNAITARMHKIPGLSNKFVYFNDDMYILNPVKPTDFLKVGYRVIWLYTNQLHLIKMEQSIFK